MRASLAFLPEAEKRQAEDDLNYAESQTNKPKPNSSILKAVLTGFVETVQQVAIRSGVEILKAQANGWLEKLPSLLPPS